MPIVAGKYVNPGWVNDQAPAMNDTEMNAISDSIGTLDDDVDATNNTVTQMGTSISNLQSQITTMGNSIGTINATLNTIRSNILTFFNATVASSAWTSTGTYADFPFSANIATAGVTTSHVPFVNFSNADAESGRFSKVSAARTNVITIYAKSRPTTTITIPSILAVRKLT